MISRLVLVGMVAALGISLPSWPECESWFHSAREWASAQLADWDTWRPRETDSCRLADAPAPAPREFRPRPAGSVVARGGDSRTGPFATAPSRTLGAPSGRHPGGETVTGIGQTPGPKALAFHPIAVDDHPVADFALELNRWAEGLDIQPSMIASRASATDRAPVPARDSDAWELVIASCRSAEASGLSGTVAAPVGAHPARIGASDPIADLFEENPEGYEPSAEGLASSVVGELPAGAVRLRFDPIEPPADLAGGIAEELNRFAEGIGDRPEETWDRLVRSPRFEPIEATDAESGIAYELNRASEGLELVLPRLENPDPPAPQLLTRGRTSGADPASPSRPGLQARLPKLDPRADRFPGGGEPNANRAPANSGLGQAIRLTRDAAFAWMDVLKGPARVTMTLR